jgi:hypothetical protein
MYHVSSDGQLIHIVAYLGGGRFGIRLESGELIFGTLMQLRDGDGRILSAHEAGQVAIRLVAGLN